MNIAILGASGCVGKNLINILLEYPENVLVGSCFPEKEIPQDIPLERLSWKQVDLLDANSTENFLNGCEILIYLIHSLGAKNFEQLDLQLANAAAFAAKKAGVKKIIYLGGIESLPHLISRMMTGQAFASFGIPVAEVRASVLLGTCSASYLIVYYLAKRLPLLITPKWLNSLCAPIAIEDAIKVISELVTKEIRGHDIFEIGSDIVCYRDLISHCGKFIRGIKNKGTVCNNHHVHWLTGMAVLPLF